MFRKNGSCKKFGFCFIYRSGFIIFYSRHRVRFSEWNTLEKENCTIINDEEVCRQDYEPANVIVHPEYDIQVRNKLHDITIIMLKEEVIFDKYVRPICLPLDPSIRELPIDREDFTVTGWGQTDTGKLIELFINPQNRKYMLFFFCRITECCAITRRFGRQN